jgi:hypothetical protein
LLRFVIKNYLRLPNSSHAGLFPEIGLNLSARHVGECVQCVVAVVYVTERCGAGVEFRELLERDVVIIHETEADAAVIDVDLRLLLHMFGEDRLGREAQGWVVLLLLLLLLLLLGLKGGLELLLLLLNEVMSLRLLLLLLLSLLELLA